MLLSIKSRSEACIRTQFQGEAPGKFNIRFIGSPTSSIAVSYTHLDVYKRQMVYCCGHGPAFGMSIYVTSGEGSQASEAVAIPVFEGSVLSLHSMVINGGHISIGAVVSMTVITCTQVSPSLQSLTAIQVRFIV